MSNQTVTIKLHDAKKVISAFQVTKTHDQPVTIQAQKGINYELIDDATQFAPENIKIQRVGNDLYIGFEDDGSNPLNPDLIIQGYYGTDGITTNLLIGLHENGNYYAYVPESGLQQHAVSMLADEVSAGQALGGEALTSAAYEFNPYWLLALIPIVGLAAAGGGGGGGGGGTPAPSADKPDVIGLNGGVVTAKPGTNNVKQVINYIDESNNTVVLTATKGSDGKWILDKTPTGVTINPSTGEVTIGMDAVKDGSTVTSTGTNSSNNTATDSDTAQVDDSTPTSADTPDVTALATGAVAVKPGEDNVKQVITYTDESDNVVTLNATKGEDGNWSLDNTPANVAIDPTTGIVAIGPDAVKDLSTVTALGSDAYNNTASDSDISKVDKTDTQNANLLVTFNSITDDTGTAGDFITNDNTLLFKGKVDIDASTALSVLSVKVGGTTYTTADSRLTVDGSGNWTLDLTGSTLADGSYAVVATVTDTAGNTASTISQNVVIDTAIDTDGDGNTVSFDSITDDTGTAGDFITNDNSLLFQGTVDLDDGNSLSVTVGATTYTTADPRLTVDGSGNWTLDLTGSTLADGSYAVVATVTDTAGNTASTISQNVVIDTVIDTDGDRKTVTFDSITTDTGTSSNDFITNDNTLLFKGTVDLDDGNQLSVKVGNTTYLSGDSRLTVDGLGNWALNLTSTVLPDGTYPVIATVTDTAGNSKSTVIQNVVIDTVIDTDGDGKTVTFDSITDDTGAAGDFITNDNTLLFKGTVDLDDGNQLSVKVGNTTYLSGDSRLTVDGLGNWTLNLTSTVLPDGTYPVIATVTDTAGNTASTISQNVVIDTVIDTDGDGKTVNFDSITDDTGIAGDFITNDNTLLFKGTVDLDDGNQLSVSVGGVIYTTADSRLTVDGLGNWTLNLTSTVLLDGTYPVIATVTDTAGNTASTISQNVVIDTVIDTDGDGKTVNFDSITDDTGIAGDFITNDNTLLFKGTVDLDDGNQLSVKVGNTTYLSGDSRLTVDGLGNWTLNLTSTVLLDGTYPVIATVTDIAGNTLSTISRDIVVNNLADTDGDGLTVTFDSITDDTGVSNSDFITNDNTLLFKGTVDLDDGTLFSVQVGSDIYLYTPLDTRFTIDGAGNWSLDLTGDTPLPDGTYAVVANMISTAGNIASSVSQNVVIDTVIDTDGDGKTVNFDSIATDTGVSSNDFITNDNTLLFKGTVDLDDGNQLSVSVGGVIYTTADSRLTVDGLGNWTLNLTSTVLLDGTYPVIATVTDTAGNTASTISQNVVIDTVIDTDGDGKTVNFDSITDDTGIAGDFITNDNQLVFQGTVDIADGNLLTVSVDGMTFTEADTELSLDLVTGIWTLDLTGMTLLDGTYPVVATVSDLAGNTASTVSQNIVIDTVANAPVVSSLIDGSVKIIPGADNVTQTINYFNEAGTPTTVTATQDSGGVWSLNLVITGVSIDPVSGIVTLDKDAVQDLTQVTSQGQDELGNIANRSGTSLADVVAPSTADAPDVVALLGGAVTSTPGANNVSQVISYTDEQNNPITLTATQALDGTWSLDNTPVGVNIDANSGIVTLSMDSVKDGSLVTSIGYNLINDLAMDADIAKGDIVTVSVSEEGLAGAYADTIGSPVDTTNSATTSGVLSLGIINAVTLTGPTGIMSGGQTVIWTGVNSGSSYTLTGRVGTTEVATLTIATSGAYTFTLKQPLDHANTSIEDILALGFTINVIDTLSGPSSSTLVINVEDDSPVAVANTIHAVDVKPTAIEGELVVSYGADHGYVKSITVDGYTLTYFPDSDSISASGTAGSITYSFNTTNDELTINKGTGEVLVVDMLTGHYSYSALATETIAAPIVGINKTASLLGLVNAEALDLIGIGTNQLLTAVDPNNDIQSVVVNASSLISVGLGNYYKLDWSAAMAAEFGLSVIEDNNILNLVLVTTQSYSKLTITSLDGGPIDNFKLNEFLATVYVHQYGLNLVSLGLAPTISISATDSQPVTSTASYTDLLGVSLLDPNNDPAGVIEGNGSANTLNGTTSDDRLYGYAGDDTLNGGQGNDLLRGGAGTDALSGGSGNDILIGGTGNDTLTGGSGNDTFLWEKGDQGTVNAGRALDIITDFSNQPVTGGGDILDLRGLLIGELAKGTSIGNLANFLFFVNSGADTILYISTDGAFGATPSSTLADQQITFQNVDLIGSFTTQQEIISNLLKNGNLLVDQATTTTDVNGASSFDVVIADNDGDTASTNLTFDSSTPLTTNPDNVAPVAQATDATLLGLVGLDALGIIDLNQQAFVVADANQNLRSVEVKFTGLLTVNLGTLTMSASNQLASDLGLEIHISNTAGVLNVVGATSTITITAVDGGNIDNLAINELLATIQLESGVDLLGLSATLGLQALGSFTVTATDNYGLTDTDTVSSLLNASVLQRLLGGDASQDIIEGSSANDTLNNSLLGTIHERLYGFDGDDTLNGGNGNDLLRGGAGNDILNGEDGNDILIDGNGADTLNGGNGNDLILISGTGFAAIDGGAGTDTLTLLGGIDLDLSAHNNITNIERIDLANGTEGSKLTLTESDVLEVTGTNTLQIFGDANDQVEMIGAIKGLSTSIGGVAVTQYTLGANTVYVDNDIVNGMGVIIV